MNELKKEDIQLKFLLNMPVEIEGIGNLYCPTLKNIVNITEEKYNQSLSAIMFNRSVLQVDKKEIEHLTDFQILSALIYQDEYFRESFFTAMELHFHKRPIINEINGFLYFKEDDEKSILTEDKMSYVKVLIMEANKLKEEEEDFNAGNDAAKEFMRKKKEKEARLAKFKKHKTNLHSIISGVGWKQGFGFLSELNIYQLYDGYARLQIIDSFLHTMNGMYAGTIDGSKIKVEDINWANII